MYILYIIHIGIDSIDASPFTFLENLKFQDWSSYANCTENMSWHNFFINNCYFMFIAESATCKDSLSNSHGMA